MRDYDATRRKADEDEARTDWWDQFMPDWREREADAETRERNDR
jgi:hypothetical protein